MRYKRGYFVCKTGFKQLQVLCICSFSPRLFILFLTFMHLSRFSLQFATRELQVEMKLPKKLHDVTGKTAAVFVC